MARLSTILLLALVDAVGHASQKPTFSTKTEAVLVDVLVTENGRPVLGLGAGDFEVLDNGVRQQVDLVSAEQVPLKVVLALDASGSVSRDRLAHLRAAAGALVKELGKEDRAALLTFSHIVVQRAAMTRDLDRVRNALDLDGTLGGTALVDGAYTGILAGEADAGRALLMIFSDGLDTSSWLLPASVLDTARRSDVVVYAVAAGASRHASFLEDLAESTGGRRIAIESTRDLSAAFVSILKEFRHRYLVSYSPRGVAGEGWHTLKVRVKTRSGTVRARPGYLVGG
jgi:VWFA-related protein